MQSFVVVVAKGYTSDARSAFDLFEAITDPGAAPPFEFDVIVANGPGIAGDVLMLYLEDAFAGVPANFGGGDADLTFLRAWLHAVCDVTQPRYIVETYGPRNHPLEGYWPHINVVKRQRLAPGAAPDEPASAEGAEPASGERDGGARDVVLMSAGNRKINVIKLVRELIGSGLKEAVDTVDGAPALLKAGVTHEEAERLKKEFAAVGATIESRPARDWLAMRGDEVAPVSDTRPNAATASPRRTEPPRAPAPRAPAPPPQKSWWQRLFTGDGAQRVAERPAPSVPPASSALTLAVRSLEVKQSHAYGGESSRKTMTAAAAYRILVADVAISNPTAQPQRFSSQQLSVLDAKGAAVDATFYGVGDTIAQSGHIISTESKTNDGDGNPVVSYKGKLSTDVSFLEWELHPHKTYQDTLVFVIPAGARGVTLRFSGSGDRPAKGEPVVPCPNCAYPVPGDRTHCPSCGTAV